MVRIAALVVGPLLAAATIGAVIRQDGRRLARIFGVGLPVAVLGTATAIAMTQLAVTVVNSLCTLITPPGAYEPFVQLGGAIGRPGIPIFVQFVLASLVVLAAIVLWMEMVLRGAVLFIAVFFLPFGLAAFIWPATAHITKRFVEIIVAVVGSKFVIVATLSLGGAFVGNNHAGIDGAVTGTAILLLAAFAPFSVLRLVPIVEASATSHLEGLSRRPAHAATSAAGAVSSAGRGAGVLGSLGARTGSAASGVMAFDVGQQQGSWAVPSSSAEASGTGVAAVASRLPASTGAPSGGGSAAPPTGDHRGCRVARSARAGAAARGSVGLRRPRPGRMVRRCLRHRRCGTGSTRWSVAVCSSDSARRSWPLSPAVWSWLCCSCADCPTAAGSSPAQLQSVLPLPSPAGPSPVVRRWPGRPSPVAGCWAFVAGRRPGVPTQPWLLRAWCCWRRRRARARILSAWCTIAPRGRGRRCSESATAPSRCSTRTTNSIA